MPSGSKRCSAELVHRHLRRPANDLAQTQRERVVRELTTRRRDARPLQEQPDRIRAVHSSARNRCAPSVNGTSSFHSSPAVIERKCFRRTSSLPVSSGKKLENADLFVGAGDQLSIDRNADQDRTDAFGRGLRVWTVSLERLRLSNPIRFLFERGADDRCEAVEGLHDELVIANDQNAAMCRRCDSRTGGRRCSNTRRCGGVEFCRGETVGLPAVAGRYGNGVAVASATYYRPGG